MNQAGNENGNLSGVLWNSALQVNVSYAMDGWLHYVEGELA